MMKRRMEKQAVEDLKRFRQLLDSIEREQQTESTKTTYRSVSRKKRDRVLLLLLIGL